MSITNRPNKTTTMNKENNSPKHSYQCLNDDAHQSISSSPNANKSSRRVFRATPTATVTSSEFENHVKQEFIILRCTMDQLNKNICDLNARLKQIASNELLNAVEISTSFPVKTVKDLEELENKIGEEPNRYIMNCEKEAKAIKRQETKEFEIKLIMEVKNHVCLYAKDNPSYSNRVSRENAWVDIALIIGKSADECQKKWNSLRDSFRAAYRTECNTPSGSAAVPKVRWMHYEALKFLIPYVKVPEDDCGNYSFNDLIVSFEEGETEIMISEEIEPNQINPKRKSESPRTPKPRKQVKTTQEDDDFNRVLKAIENSSNSPSAPKKAVHVFFESIALQAEKFSFRKQIELQQKVLNLLSTDFAADL